jgi:hypothetical protein
MPRYLCPKEIAGMLGVSVRSAQRLMASGDIESFKCGPRLWRTTQEQLSLYVADQFARYRRAL